MFDEIIPHNAPVLDLHGEGSDISRIYLKDFILENYKLKNKYFLIVHGIGKGILLKTVHEELRSSSLVLDFKIDMYNPGCTIVKLNTK